MEWKEASECWKAPPEVQDLFFSDDEDAQKVAQALCSSCPVLELCFEYSVLTKPKVGIWAMHTVTQRRRVIRKANKQPETFWDCFDASVAKISADLLMDIQAAQLPKVAPVAWSDIFVSDKTPIS